MLIDWFTVCAQALNFLVLVWLMKRFLYQPILQAVDAREQLIAKELSEAAATKAEAEKERDEFAHKNQDIDGQRAGLLAKAISDAKAERDRLMAEARQAADALKASRMEAMRSDAANLGQELGRRTQSEVFAITRRTLQDLASQSLDERATDVFLSKLRTMDPGAKALIAESLNGSSGPATLRSAFDLPPAQHQSIQTALNETFSAEVRVQFQTAPDLVSGIELIANGQKLSWNIADYLTTLEKGVGELLKVSATPAPTGTEADPIAKVDATKGDAAKADANGKGDATGTVKSA